MTAGLITAGIGLIMGGVAALLSGAPTDAAGRGSVGAWPFRSASPSVTLGVYDVEATTTFYRRLGWRQSTHSGDGIPFFTPRRGPIIALWTSPALAVDGGWRARRMRRRRRPSVASRSSINFDTATRSTWRSRRLGWRPGARCRSPPRRPSGVVTAATVRDPDGNLWEFAHNPFWPLDDAAACPELGGGDVDWPADDRATRGPPVVASSVRPGPECYPVRGTSTTHLELESVNSRKPSTSCSSARDIMSATLGSCISQLEPDWSIRVYERLGEVAQESSNAWNNAGTGHAALCEHQLHARGRRWRRRREPRRSRSTSSSR